MIKQIEARANIRVLTGAVTTEFHNSLGNLNALSYSLGEKTVREDADACFIFIGAKPQTAWLGNLCERDAQGYILSGAEVKSLDRPRFNFETSCNGIFVSGDCRSGSVKRVAAACGEGAVSISSVHSFLSSLG